MMRNENMKFDRYDLYSSDHNQLEDTKNKEISWLTVSLLMVSLKVDCKNVPPINACRQRLHLFAFLSVRFVPLFLPLFLSNSSLQSIAFL
jgi:hypothetical protein